MSHPHGAFDGSGRPEATDAKWAAWDITSVQARAGEFGPFGGFGRYLRPFSKAGLGADADD